MTKCKRMLVAILILSMLSSNVAYASGGNMGTVASTQEAVVTNVDETVVESTEEEDSSDMLYDISVSENATEETVEESSEISDEDVAVEETTVEETTVEETVAETTVEETVETTEEVTTEVSTTEEVTTEELTTEEVGKTHLYQTTEAEATIQAWLAEMVPESYTLYSDGYSAVTVSPCPDTSIDRYYYTVLIEETSGKNMLEVPKLTNHGMSYGPLYRVAKGKENGTTSVTVTMTYNEAKASVEVPVNIVSMPEGYEKVNDPGLFIDLCQWSKSTGDWLLDETDMAYINDSSNYTIKEIDLSEYPAYLETTDMSEYLESLEVLYIEGSENSATDWEFNYDIIKNMSINGLYISRDADVTELDFGGFNKIKRIEVKYMSNLKNINFSDTAESLAYFAVQGSNVLESVTIADGVEIPALTQVSFNSCALLSDISFAAGLPNLEKISLDYCKGMSDISVLKNCPKLTGSNAINLYNTSIGAEDVVALMHLPDIELVVAEEKIVPNNITYSAFGDSAAHDWSMECDSDIVNVSAYMYSSGRTVKAIKPGVAKLKIYPNSNPDNYRELYVYVKAFPGITGQLGEPVAEEVLPEIYTGPYRTVMAIWDKVSQKVVDMVDKKDIVEDVVQYAGCWVYGIEESGAEDTYDARYSSPYYYTGITVSENGVSSYTREYDSDAEYDRNNLFPSKIVYENTVHEELNDVAIKQIGNGCILTESGVLYCISSDNELLKIATGVTEFLDYNSTNNGIIYRKGNNLYNSMTGTTKVRTDIQKFIQGSLYAVSSSCTYEIWYGGADEVKYPISTEDNHITSKVLKQSVDWNDGYLSGQYHLLEDGMLYNGSKLYIQTDVKSIDPLGYIKTVDGKDVRYVFTGEEVSEFDPDGSYDTNNMAFDYMLGKKGLYRSNGAFVLSDVNHIYTNEKAHTLSAYAIRTDGSVWHLDTDYGDGVPEKIYPVATEPIDPVEEATSIAFAQEEIVLENETAQQMSVTVLPEGSEAGTITYSIDNHRIATVTASGMLRAVKNGVTTLYAKTENGLTASCKVTVRLPIKLTGIALEETDILLKEGDSKALTVIYTPEDTTEDKTITWTSSDPEKVSVDEDGTIHALKGTMGTPVTITGVSEAHEELKVTCDVSVNRILTEEEIVVPSGIVVTNNVTKTLADITLPQGWAFKEPSTVLEHGEKSFPAVYTQEYCEPAERDITILINHISEVTISGNDTFEAKESETYSLEMLTEGVGEVQDCYDIAWKIKNTGIATIDGSNKEKSVAVTGVKAGSTKLTVNVTLKNAEGKVCETLSAETTLTINPAGVVDNVKIILGEDALSHGLTIEETDNTIHIPYNQKSETDDTVTFAKKYSFTIDANCYRKGNENPQTGVKWSTSDKKVATVKTTNGVTKVTLAGDGIAVLTATANDEGKSKATVVISVEDYTPRMESSTLTLNKALEEGVLFRLYPAYEKELLQDVTVYEKKSGVLTESAMFEVTKDADDTYGYRLNLKNDVSYASVKNKTYKNLYLNVEVAGEGTYSIPVKVKVTASLPSVTIKQSDKLNLFYTDDTATFGINAKNAVISSVEYIAKTTDAAAPQVTGEWNETDNTLTLEQANITLENYKKIVNKGTIRITFEGYREEAYGTKGAYEKAVTVSKEYKQPQWVLTTNKITLYGSLSNVIKVGVYDKADKSKSLIGFDESEIALDAEKLTNAYSVSVGEDDLLCINVSGSKATEKLPILLAKDNFRESKKLTLKVTMKKEDVKPSYKVSSKSVTLNKQCIGKEEVLLDLNLGTASDMSVIGLNVYEKGFYCYDSVVDFTYLEESGQIAVSLNSIPTATKYEYEIQPVMETDGNANLELAKTKIKINIINKTPTIKLTGKGTINPVDRENTSVQVTPKIANLKSPITGVEITNEYKSLFKTEIVNGKIVIKAAEASEQTKLVHNQKYKLTLKISTEGGHVFDNVSFTVTPKQGTVKISKSVAKITCYKPVKGVKYSVPLTFAVTSPKGAQIDSIELVNNTDNFVYDEVNGKLYLENADMLTAKEYKLKFKIICEGACDNAKSTEVTVKVNLKK